VSLDLCPVDRAGQYATITLPAEVGVTNADQVRAELLQAISGGPELLVVDMTGTSYCGAAGIHALMRARGRAGDAGIGLRVVISTPTVRRILELTGADQLIDVYSGLDAALAALPVPGTSLPVTRTDLPAADGRGVVSGC
jgi:anti-anti-sigma factor